MHGTPATANNSTKIMCFFGFRFENSIQLILDHKRGKIFCVTSYLKTISFKTVQAKFCRKFNFNNYPKKSKIYRWVHIFQATRTVTTSTRKQKIPDLGGTWLQDVLTMWMQWKILLEEVWKSSSEDVPKNLVFHVHCRIKSLNFCPSHLVWLFWNDWIAF